MSWNFLFPSVAGTPDGARATNAQQIRNTLTKDTIKNKLVFEVRVLTPCVKTHMSTMAVPLPTAESAEKEGQSEIIRDAEVARIAMEAMEATEYYGAGAAAASPTGEAVDYYATRASLPPLTDNTYSFFGRIEDDPDLPFISPHAQLTDPCNISLTAKPTYALELIKLHTQFISKSGYARNGPEPVVGDRVQVILDKGDISYNLQYCYFEEISNTSDKEIINEMKETECLSLEMMFENFDEDTDLSTYMQNLTPADAAALASQSLARNARIQRFFAAAWPFLPPDTTLNSSGRTIGYGHNMIVRMAKDAGIAVLPGAAPKSDVSTWDPAYVERLRQKLKAPPHNKAIANPANSNHCIGPGCKNSGRIAIDMSAGSLQALSAGLLRFRDSTAPNGLNAMIADGTLKETFAPGSSASWIGPGWKIEPYNGAVHAEIKIIEGAETAAAAAHEEATQVRYDEAVSAARLGLALTSDTDPKILYDNGWLAGPPDGVPWDSYEVYKIQSELYTDLIWIETSSETEEAAE